jgi:hypothetical protein
MDILLSADQKRFKEECRIFAAKAIAPLAGKYGETDTVPGELIRTMADAQLFRLLVPEEWGGKGVKSMPICLVREQLAGVYCVADVTFAMQGLGSYPIVLAGNEEQKARFGKRRERHNESCPGDGRRIYPERLETVYLERTGGRYGGDIREDAAFGKHQSPLRFRCGKADEGIQRA